MKEHIENIKEKLKPLAFWKEIILFSIVLLFLNSCASNSNSRNSTKNEETIVCAGYSVYSDDSGSGYLIIYLTGSNLSHGLGFRIVNFSNGYFILPAQPGENMEGPFETFQKAVEKGINIQRAFYIWDVFKPTALNSDNSWKFEIGDKIQDNLGTLWFDACGSQVIKKNTSENNQKDGSSEKYTNGANETMTNSSGSEYSETQANFEIIKIGSQSWCTKNLNISTYKNGDAIPQVQDANAWENLRTGAWCYYENKKENGTTYGKLYNWYAVNDHRGLAPKGYHIPSDEEWTTLTDFLGAENIASMKMKSKSGWNNEGNGNNESNFAGLPGGNRHNDGIFYDIGNFGFWWSASKNTRSSGAYGRCLGYYFGDVSKYHGVERSGLSVRCLGDLINENGAAPSSDSTLPEQGNVTEIIEPEKAEIFSIVEQMPSFPGGDAAMTKWIKDKIEAIGYPKMEKEAGIFGTCYVTYVIDKEGNVNNIKILRGVDGGDGYNIVAIQVVKSMPKWVAGKQNGREVSVQYNLPIKFVRNNN